jgi:hypothetical protein
VLRASPATRGVRCHGAVPVVTRDLHAGCTPFGPYSNATTLSVSAQSVAQRHAMMAGLDRSLELVATTTRRIHTFVRKHVAHPNASVCWMRDSLGGPHTCGILAALLPLPHAVVCGMLNQGHVLHTWQQCTCRHVALPFEDSPSLLATVEAAGGTGCVTLLHIPHVHWFVWTVSWAREPAIGRLALRMSLPWCDLRLVWLGCFGWVWCTNVAEDHAEVGQCQKLQRPALERLLMTRS